MESKEDKPSGEEAQKAGSGVLQEQIDALIEGKAKPAASEPRPQSLREFIQESMAKEPATKGARPKQRKKRVSKSRSKKRG